jgi:outer membrane protein
VLTPAQTQQLRSSNQTFPFKFISNPYMLSLGLSLPLFNGFQREQTIESSAADQSDAQYNLKAQQLKLTADVQSDHVTLVADYRALKLQESNSVMAREALQLAEERYRVGLNSLVDLQQARSDYETAEAGRINAVFEFHRAFAALESAVGRSLR